MRPLFAMLLILSLAGCIARPVCGWQGYDASALATAEAGVLDAAIA